MLFQQKGHSTLIDLDGRERESAGESIYHASSDYINENETRDYFPLHPLAQSRLLKWILREGKRRPGGENVLKICLQTSRGRDLFEAVELMEHFAFPSTGFEPRTILATPSLADYVQRLDRCYHLSRCTGSYGVWICRTRSATWKR